MSTDPAALEAAFQAQMADLLAPLQGQMQALVAQLNAAAAAFAPQAPDHVAIDPAIVIQPGPPKILWATDAPVAALPLTVASGIQPADLRQEAPALIALAYTPAPEAAATPEPPPILLPAAATDPAPAWFACFERQGDAGEGGTT